MVAMVIHEKFAFVIYVNLSWLKYFFTNKLSFFSKTFFKETLKYIVLLKKLIDV